MANSSKWWYDQQSAEDQALIDSGELDYPENLQPENFVNSFALGDSTKLNLLDNGNILLRSAVSLQNRLDATSGSEYPATDSVLIGRQRQGLGIAAEGRMIAHMGRTGNRFLIDSSVGSVNGRVVFASGAITKAFADTLVDDNGGTTISIFSSVPNNTTEAGVDYTDINLINYNAIGPADGVANASAPFLSYRGFNVNESNLVPVEDASDGGFLRAFSCNVNTALNKSHWNYYASGDAPNWYRGNALFGGPNPTNAKVTINSAAGNITCDGKITQLQPLALTLRQQ